jgi:gliding motility-associated-like protein
MTYTVPGTAGCSSVAATKAIKVNQIETPTFDAIGPICSGTPLILSNTSKNGIFGTWSPSADNLATTTYTFTPISGQCANTNTLTVEVYTITASVKEEETKDDSLKLTALGGVSYSWSTGQITESIKVIESGKYNVLVTDQNGCSLSKDIYVFINKVECTDVFVPNMFSPNGDNINDKLVVEGSCIVDFDLRIFNRWGEMVFQSKDKIDSWDGKFKGKSLNSGVYSYVFEYTDNENQFYRKIGNITIMK